MSAEARDVNGQGNPGLPPVAPPSGRFIAQLFLVPSLIVLVLVLIWLGGHYLVAERRTPASYLRELDSTNDDIRWRGAHELAQVLKRPESITLASDVKFALDLAERLQRALDELEQNIKVSADRIAQLSVEEQTAAWRQLGPKRNQVLFLVAALGDFTVPVGAPLLMDLASKPNGPDVKGSTLLRRRALWALANLGENQKRYQTLPGDRKFEIQALLAEESKASTTRGRWAQLVHGHLTRNEPLGVDAALEKVSYCDDPYARRLVAFAFNFWEGPRAEPTLIRLAHDDGHGVQVEITTDD